MPTEQQQQAIAPPPQGLPSSIVPPQAVAPLVGKDSEDGEPPATHEMPVTAGPPPRSDTPAAGTSTALVPLSVAKMELELDRTAVPGGGGRGRHFDNDDDFDDYPDDEEPTRWRTVALVLAATAVVLALLSGAVASLLADSTETEGAAAEGGGGGAGDGSGLVATTDGGVSTSVSSTSSSTSSTSSTSTSTTSSTSSTTAPTTTVPATTAPTTVPPTTAAPTTTRPAAPTIDSFSVDVDDRGCGFGASPAHFSWSTSNATSVTLGRVGSGASGVAVDGSSGEICVADFGETWRLTATGPGGTVTRDVGT